MSERGGSKNAARAVGLAMTLAAGGAAAQPAPSPSPTAAPKLVVTIVVDQLGSNLFEQYRPQFTGGFATLASEGLVYGSGFQTHAVSETCPGHSTILTGVHPNRTGIAANDWFDREAGRSVYCLNAPRNRLAHGGEDAPVGPDNLRAPVLGDWLKARDGRSRVYAVSGKDRGAITLTGPNGNGAWWYANGFGWTTHLRPGETAAAKLRPVSALNARVGARLKANPPGWTATRPQCARLSGEWPIAGGVFRSALPPERFALDTSPVLDELTLEAAETLIREQRLGAGRATDVLGVSLSATDRIGHRYGTQGPEMCDHLHRLDRALGRFLDQLRAVPGGALVVLTADHGGSDFPERLKLRGHPEAGRADPALAGRLNSVLRARLKLDWDPLVVDGPGAAVVGPDGKGLVGPRRAEIAAAAAELLRAEPGVAAAYTIDELVSTPSAARDIHPDELSVRERMALSAVLGRTPDVSIAFNPGVSPYPARLGGYIAGHGSPWDYDRRVPIIFWRPGAQGQERLLPIRTVDIAPTLAGALRVDAPADLDGRCLDIAALGLAPCPARKGIASAQD
jgi:predicted AlkP superfamily pyrophosphatase or phosphodiesterase